MSTVAEVEARVREFERRMQLIRPAFDAVVLDAFRLMTEMRLPCIKYGRRKRKMRLAIPHGSRKLPSFKINIR